MRAVLVSYFEILGCLSVGLELSHFGIQEHLSPRIVS